MEKLVDFSQYCTVLAEPAARSQIALIDTRGAHPTLALGNDLEETPFLGEVIRLYAPKTQLISALF